MSKKLENHSVVFDGSSCYVIPREEVTVDLHVLCTSTSIDKAQAYCDRENDKINAGLKLNIL